MQGQGVKYPMIVNHNILMVNNYLQNVFFLPFSVKACKISSMYPLILNFAIRGEKTRYKKKKEERRKKKKKEKRTSTTME